MSGVWLLEHGRVLMMMVRASFPPHGVPAGTISRYDFIRQYLQAVLLLLCIGKPFLAQDIHLYDFQKLTKHSGGKGMKIQVLFQEKTISGRVKIETLTIILNVMILILTLGGLALETHPVGCFAGESSLLLLLLLLG